MNEETLARWGVPHGDPMRHAFQTIKHLYNEGLSHETVRSQLLSVIRNPERFRNDPHWSRLARELAEKPGSRPADPDERPEH